MQAAKLSITDIYDAIVELVTNADDRYQHLGTPGRIEIEVERRRGESHGRLVVRDFADGMTAATMDERLSRMGGRVSGLEKGVRVRGTNSRGAKDVAALGNVTFDSIAVDAKYHACEISRYLEFTLRRSTDVTEELREKLGIKAGTGTVVAIDLDNTCTAPQHDTLRDRLERLVPLRDILNDARRTIVLRDLNRGREETLRARQIEGTERLAEAFVVPGYEHVKAKLTIKRATKPFERESQRFRLGGILVKSRHAIHEASLFDSGLENDVHAQSFFGRLVCEGIDDLWNEYDDRFANKVPFDPANATPVIDPSRRTGLTKDHPFVKALIGEVLTRLRPLVEEERSRREKEKASIENSNTRRRLNDLERVASAFLHDKVVVDEPSVDTDSKDSSSGFKRKGYSIQPPFAQLVIGHSRNFALNILQEAFPELQVGEALVIECLSTDISSDSHVCGLEPHPSQPGVLRARWKIKGMAATAATGVRVRVGRIVAEAAVEVLGSESDKYLHVMTLQFERQRYRALTTAGRKRVRLVGPIAQFAEPTQVAIRSSSRRFKPPVSVMLQPHEELGIASAEFHVRTPDVEDSCILSATVESQEVTTTLHTIVEAGAGLKIKIEDIDLGNQRYRLQNNVLEIAAKHPSLRRYLGPPKEFPGQNSLEFRVLIAEIVADAVCANVLSRNSQESPEEYEKADWDLYYAEYSALLTQFLPIAHKVVCPESAIGGT
ncbi:MAG: ATP-binding protein [Planctomycetota bacterium]